MPGDDDLLLLGIRHHGPGSAACVVGALKTYQPDCLLVEGAPEAEPLLAYLGDSDLQPPVAQLVYADDDYRDSAFYPFAEFSPEWQAMLQAKALNIPLRFFDLPLSHSLGIQRETREQQLSAADKTLDTDQQEIAAEPGNAQTEPVPTETDSSLTEQTAQNTEQTAIDSLKLAGDPLDALAHAAGFDDGERWWEHVVEQHQHDIEVFAAIADAMGAVRETLEQEQGISRREQLREAWMRRQIRQARKDGFCRIAVVCGAWHVPALIKPVKIKDDNALLKGLPKVKLKSTWIPWSYARISLRNGYGAGIQAPGWYHYLWQYNQATNEGSSTLVASWLTLAARTLRKKGIDVAPSSVIDAVRLANTLAALRNSPKPSLQDMNETIQTLFCFGDSTPMQLLTENMMIGERLGSVPDALPKAPLQQDLEKQCKSLRLKTEGVEKTLQLDLRKDIGKKRSALFHQLEMLAINWAEAVTSRASRGTFRETWLLRWQPDFELELIGKSIWGNTLETAASRFALDAILNSENLTEITDWLNKLLLANLSDNIPRAIQHLNEKAALIRHIDGLAAALPRLINIVRYGDVRNTDTAALQHLVDSFISRICIGLSSHCHQLDDDAANVTAGLLNDISEALNILQNSQHLDQWFSALAQLSEFNDINGLVIGRSYRLLLNADRIDPDWAASAFSFALSRAEDPQQAANWIEGLLDGAGMILIHDDRIWSVLDRYLCQLDDTRFQNMLPLLRRTFVNFSDSERDNLQLKAACNSSDNGPMFSPHNSPETQIEQLQFNHERAEKSLDLLRQILGFVTVDEDDYHNGKNSDA